MGTINRLLAGPVVILILGFAEITSAQPGPMGPEQLVKRGEQLYLTPGACITCHGESAEGNIGPTLEHGPSPYDIGYQLQTNPQMAPVNEY